MKGKSNWTQDQNAAAQNKADAGSDGQSLNTTNPAPRPSNLRQTYTKAGGKVSPTEDVDHVRDLQLGGTNDISNLQPLDKSVNRSFGKQLQLQLKNLPDNTKVNKIIFIPHPNSQLPPAH